MRSLLRRFLLGHGPLKRTSDRLHALSRLFLLASATATLPAAVATGTAMATALHATADHQATERHQQSAILLADAPKVDQATAEAPADGRVLALATWAAPDRQLRKGHVLVPAGAPTGRVVRIWVDRAGTTTDPPLAGSDVTAEAVVAATLIGLTLPTGAAVIHVLAVRLIDRSRDRRWTAEWASIEPLWAGRTS
jgi:hypothetical protein